MFTTLLTPIRGRFRPHYLFTSGKFRCPWSRFRSLDPSPSPSADPPEPLKDPAYGMKRCGGRNLTFCEWTVRGKTTDEKTVVNCSGRTGVARKGGVKYVVSRQVARHRTPPVHPPDPRVRQGSRETLNGECFGLAPLYRRPSRFFGVPLLPCFRPSRSPVLKLMS